jgi:hypothetical protein
MIRKIADPGGRDLEAPASEARYVGSPEHKDVPSFAGQPKHRADASICDRSLAADRERAQGWLEKAIRRGAVSEHWEGRFPRYVWYKEGETVYEGRLVNRDQGWYKGYPLTAEESPPGIEVFYE